MFLSTGSTCCKVHEGAKKIQIILDVVFLGNWGKVSQQSRNMLCFLLNIQTQSKVNQRDSVEKCANFNKTDTTFKKSHFYAV